MSFMWQARKLHGEKKKLIYTSDRSNDILIHTIFTHFESCIISNTLRQPEKECTQHNACRLLLHVSSIFTAAVMRVTKSSQFFPNIRSLGERRKKEGNNVRLCVKNVEQFFADISQLNFGSNRWGVFGGFEVSQMSRL